MSNRRELKGLSYVMIKIFIKINNHNTLTKLAKETDYSITSIRNNCDFLFKKELIKYLNVGREIQITYTFLGTRLFNSFQEVYNILNEVKK